MLLDVLSVSWNRVHDAATGEHSEGTCGLAVLFLLHAQEAAFTSNQKAELENDRAACLVHREVMILHSVQSRPAC